MNNLLNINALLENAKVVPAQINFPVVEVKMLAAEHIKKYENLVYTDETIKSAKKGVSSGGLN